MDINYFTSLGYKLDLQLSSCNKSSYYILTVYHNNNEIYTENVTFKEMMSEHPPTKKFISICRRHIRDIKINQLLNDNNG